jgi:hypothetical protein
MRSHREGTRHRNRNDLWRWTVRGRVSTLTVAGLLALCALPAAAQEKPAAPPSPAATAPALPTLTEVQRLTIETKVQTVELANRNASPEGIAAAVKQIIENAIRQSQAAVQDVNTYLQTLQIPGCQLNLENLKDIKYVQAPGDVKCVAPAQKTEDTPKPGGRGQ